MADNAPYTNTNTPYTQPIDQGRPQDRVRETTVVKTGNSNAVIAAVVLFVLLGIAAFIFWAGDDNMTATPAAAPEAAISEQVAPNTAVEPAQPVPAPDAPAIAPEAPAAPAETAPAPANDG